MLRPYYYIYDAKKVFDESSLPHKEIVYRQFEETLKLCSNMVQNYRGKIQMYELGGYAAISLGLLIIVSTAMGLSS